jgi:hypothetical protein
MPRRIERDDTNSRDRSPYRDNDDVRDPLPSDERAETKPDTKPEARGDAREAVGNTARDTSVVRSRKPTENKVRKGRRST